MTTHPMGEQPTVVADAPELTGAALEERVRVLQDDLRKTQVMFAEAHQKRDTMSSTEFDRMWAAGAEKCKHIRIELHALTGFWEGHPPTKIRRPDADLLDATYASPDEVPKAVMAWVRKMSVITSDASDAVRWSRIVGTLGDERYEEGEITVYRAVDGEEIRPGDWVTTSEDYAQEHLRRHLKGRGVVLSLTIDGADLLASPTGNPEESIYAPREFSGPYQPNS